jgi:hypothetical protein
VRPWLTESGRSAWNSEPWVYATGSRVRPVQAGMDTHPVLAADFAPRSGMSDAFSSLPMSERKRAVEAFDALYGDLEDVLWCLSQNTRAPLLKGESSPVVESMGWTVKGWWAIQGVNSEAKGQMAQALAGIGWTQEDFAEPSLTAGEAEKYACKRVERLVAATRQHGLPRIEYSWCSKVLHWLQPWRIPIYDAFVRRRLKVPESESAASGYRVIAEATFDALRSLEADRSWIGARGSGSPIRAIDKCFWWQAGGADQRSVIPKDPWKVIRQLGLSREPDPT